MHHWCCLTLSRAIEQYAEHLYVFFLLFIHSFILCFFHDSMVMNCILRIFFSSFNLFARHRHSVVIVVFFRVCLAFGKQSIGDFEQVTQKIIADTQTWTSLLLTIKPQKERQREADERQRWRGNGETKEQEGMMFNKRIQKLRGF